MLRSSVIRASRSSASIVSSAARQAVRTSPAGPISCLQQQQVRQAHAISNPTLANIEKRWEDMPPQEQADLWMSLRDRMKVDWKELTMQEKKAGAYEFQSARQSLDKPNNISVVSWWFCCTWRHCGIGHRAT